MVALGKKTEDTGARLTYEERECMYRKNCSTAMEKAAQSDKISYKSTNNPKKFLKFLEDRLTMWEDLKDKSFYAKRMYEKTHEIVNQRAYF